jgi:hypothetical protein
MRTVWSSKIVKLLPLIQFLVQIYIVLVTQQLIKLLLVGAVRAFDLAVELRCSRFDIRMSDTQVFDMPVELRLELVPAYVTMDAMNEERYDYVLRLRGKHMVPQLERAIREAYRIGVRIATGTDHCYEEDAINRISIEVEHFVEFGMSNFDALQTATVNSAELLQMADRTGRIEEGFEAGPI